MQGKTKKDPGETAKDKTLYFQLMGYAEEPGVLGKMQSALGSWISAAKPTPKCKTEDLEEWYIYGWNEAMKDVTQELKFIEDTIEELEQMRKEKKQVREDERRNAKV